ncbi:NAD(P)-dependent oxidoreductase [Clostridiaceae bacterium]|nr:NAD(P)-dependent oxidoreductase [Clostridiaceae bacterium]RKI16899.1 NAD(P)-dependent oxidoreductase [bacterium 1XD21-70]
MDKTVAEDMEYISKRVEHGSLDGSRVLVSGATGLIGKYLVRFLAQYCNCTVFALVRQLDQAYGLWGDLGDKVRYICSDITKLEPADCSVDYMIHGASVTSSKAFSSSPVETIYTSVEGTRRMLEFARKNPVKGFLFLSSMEVYGTPLTDDKIYEFQGTDLDTMSVRTSYPESKRLCESLCTAYFSEYHVPARVLRLTQTFGPGVAYGDTRVFAEFARCAMEGKDIVLHTKGETKRNYLYLADACTAALAVLIKGADGEAYNGANEDTYCTIKDMAQLVASQCGKSGIRVRVELEDEVQEKFGYAPVLRMNLDTSKLQGLGWKPEIGLADMYRRMIRCMG